MKTTKLSAQVLLFALVAAACSKPAGESQTTDKPTAKLDIAAIEQALEMKGTEKNGEYKVTVAQNDLDVVVDSFRIIPPMGLGSWAAFTASPEGAMVMGDIVVTETDLKYVQEEVIRQGLTVTAIHNHFVRDKPHVMYMHISGMGAAATLAQGVKTIFAKVKEVRGHNPAEGNKTEVQNTLDTEALDAILGSKGEMSRGVYKHTIGRSDITLQDHSTAVSSFLGFNTWAAWQGTPEHAAVAGDFAMLENEVAPVIKTLVENGIEVVAVHNHMVHEEPRIFFLHYWGVGPVEKLAQGLKAALGQTGQEKRAIASIMLPAGNETICR